jgi:tetratricopeptide (TPR) repeat protein
MSKHVTRRTALAAGVSATAGLLGGSATGAPVPKGDNKSWVGKTVLPKKSILLGHDLDNEAIMVLVGASWEVKAEKDDLLQIIDGGLPCWVPKGNVVLLADAIELFTKAVKDSDGKDAYAYNFRGWAKYLLGKPDEAVKDFDKFLERLPTDDADSINQKRQVGLSNRGLVLAEMGKFDAAIKDLDEAVKLGHTPAQLNRGWAYELKGDYKKAAEDYASILNLRPSDALALNNMAWLRATCPNATFRDGKAAVKLAKQVCELSGNREGTHLDTLAAAYAEAGDFAAAVKTQGLALEDVGYTKKYGDDAEKRLQLYKDKKPYRSAPLK